MTKWITQHEAIEKTLIVNAARIHTRSPHPEFNCILLNGKQIEAIGTYEQFLPEIRNGIHTVNADGATILPGFIDAHNHFCLMAADMDKINLENLLTGDEVLKRIHEKTDSMPHPDIIWCVNYEYEFIPPEQRLCAADLDQHFPGIPIILVERTGHMALSNEFTLKKAGIDWHTCECQPFNKTSDFSGNICGCGNAALEQYFAAMSFSEDKLCERLTSAARMASSHGVTGIHVICNESDFPTLWNFQTELPLHLKIFRETKDVQAVSVLGLRQIGGCGDVILDGDTGPYTAAFLEPYTIMPETKGCLHYTDEELFRYIEEAHTHDLQIGLHCVGDAASTQLLNAYTKIARMYPNNLRHRIEHFEFANDEMIQRAKNLNICLSIQPAFNYIWSHDTYFEILGEERALQADRIRSLVDAGIHVCFGSDCPVTPCDPLLTIHSAVNHSNPRERIDPAAAIDCHTYQGAYCGFDENRYGSITPGMIADLVFLDADPLAVHQEKIKDITILRTIFEGETVFEN